MTLGSDTRRARERRKYLEVTSQEMVVKLVITVTVVIVSLVD